jgi:hypothetical protein
MQIIRIGQIVKYHNPYPDEDPKQKYIVLEIKESQKDTRVDISPVDFGFEYPPIFTVNINDLVIDC